MIGRSLNSTPVERLSLEIDSSPAYEFILTLCVFGDPAGQATYEVGADWFKTIRAQASPDLLTAVERFGGGSDLVWAHLLSLAYETPAPRDVSGFLAHLRTVDPLEVRLRVLGYYVRYFRRATAPEVIAAAAAGDAGAQQHYLETSYPDDASWQTALRLLLPLDAETTRDRLLDILHRWHEEVFRPREPTLLPILRRDADQKRMLAQSLSARDAIDAALPGIEYVPELGINRLLLIPSYVVRPQIHSFEHHDVKIFAYPVADESLTAEPGAPPPQLLRLLRALADERRLSILKRLTAGNYTLHELATYFEVGSTTVLHHLVILRSAGLVRLTAASPKRYVLTAQGAFQLSSLLQEYLRDGRG